MTQDVNVIKGNVGRIYVLKGGQVKDPLRMADFHPLSNTSGLLVHIEDGGGLNSLGKINFAPQLRGDNNVAYHWFPMYFRGFVEATVSSENAPRTFAQYFVHVPSQVLAMNENRKDPMNVALTMVVQGGINYLGQFSTLLELNTEHLPTEDLSNDLVLGFVWEVGKRGFYQVEWDASSSEYSWKKISDGQAYARLQRKQYNLSYMTVQGGYAPQIERQALKDPQFEALMLEINDINSRLYQYSVDFNDLEIRVAEVESRNIFTNEEKTKVSKIVIDGAGIKALFNDGTYKEVPLISAFNSLESRVTTVEIYKADKDTTYTKNEIINLLLGKLDVEVDGSAKVSMPETIVNRTVVNVGYLLAKLLAESLIVDGKLLLKVDTLTEIAGLPIGSGIAMDNLVNQLRTATNFTKGLMSAVDKGRLDTLYTLLTEDEEDWVDTIQEILEILENYPEGINLAELLGDLRSDITALETANFVRKLNDIEPDQNGFITIKSSHIKNFSDILEINNVDISAVLDILWNKFANYYTKGEVYSEEQIDTKLNYFKAFYGWHLIYIGTFDNSNDTISENQAELYDVLLFQTIDGETGHVIVGSLEDDEYIKFGGITLTYNEPDYVLSDLDLNSVKVYGLKMEQQRSENIIYIDGVTVKDEFENKELELREIGETIIERDNYGNAIRITTPFSVTEIERDFKGSILKITETYDGTKEYETTIDKDYYGRVVKVNKERVN